MTPDRPFDLVLFGATGFTGGLTAEYLARNAPDGCRWALAGRNRAKLEAVRSRLAEADPALAEMSLLLADVDDPASLAEVARSSRVVVSTVGPYLRYGEPLVAACAEAGTDYADLTGEPEFVDRMYVKYHEQAVRTGARIVHACGFDSIPYDLGALFTVKQLPEGVPIELTGMVRAGAKLSGGTFHAAVTAMSRRREALQAAADRRTVEPRPEGRRARAVKTGPKRENGFFLIPLPTLDPLVVKRSASALDRYGPDFSYRHYAAVRSLPYALGGVAAVAGMFAAAQVPPARKALLSRLSPGDGPDAGQRAKSWFKVRFVGEGDGKRVVTEVAGGDPGYDETAKMLAESAMCLAFDDNPKTAGQVTTAVAMGENLIDRLVKVGISFSTLN